eukprot:jgi/Tetstr1/449524/TSEL_036612.t1
MAAPAHSSEDTVGGECGGGLVTKPLSDTLEYRHLRLDNALEVIVVSDPETDKAAAAMDVRVGSFSDPAELPGLAHFTEHMLFYASEKYPEEDAYNRFVSEHGGSTNAYTASEHTNYHFSVNWEHLHEALDRFAQFFLCPLISSDGVEREINAVDSEHSKNINSDAWRSMQLWKHLSSRGHPFHKFATGNLSTLQEAPRAAGLDVHARMKEFYSTSYSANLMKLVVYGKEDLDALEAMVRGMVAGVANSQLAPLEVDPDMFGDNVGFLARVVPVGESSTLDLQWAIPPEYKSYRYSPAHYVSHLLGHEGPGSCFQLLKAKKWVTSLAAGESGLSISSRSLFNIRVDLTDHGHDNAMEVVHIIFQYIQLLRAPGGVAHEIFDELKALAEMNFNFRDKQSPASIASSMATAMHIYPTPDTLLGMYSVPFEFNEPAIREVLACLTPRQVRIMWSSKKHAGEVTDTEPIYGTQFKSEPIAAELMEQWEVPTPSPELAMPDINPFVPTDFSIVEEPKILAPLVVLETELQKLWYMPDHMFMTPKAYMYVDFTCPEPYSTPEAAVLTRLWIKLLVDYLNSLTYYADLAGLHYSLSNTATGFQVAVYGYSHKLGVLLDKVLSHILEFEVKEDRFMVCKEQLTREYANMRYEQPYQRAMYQTSILFDAKRWHIGEYMAVIGDLAPEDLTRHHSKLLSRTFAEVLVMGNVSRAGACNLAQQVADMQRGAGSRQLFPSQRADTRIVQLPHGMPLLLAEPGPNPDNENSAVVITFQIDAEDLRTKCLAQLLAQLGKPAAFHQLRTVEQLGYIVFLVAQSDSTVMNVRFILQSSTYTAAHMQASVDGFLPMLAEKVRLLEQAEFDKQVGELYKAKLEKPKRLSMEAGRIWREIVTGTCLFDRPQREVEVLQQLTLDDLRGFFRDYIMDVASRKLLSVHVLGKHEAAGDGAEEAAAAGAAAEGRCRGWGAPVGDCSAEGAAQLVRITDVAMFKRAQALFPSTK